MRQQQGFTLIELAVVIAIIAILAAAAIPRFGDTTAQAECTSIRNFASQLSSAAAIYTAENAQTPNNFGNYVKVGALAAGDPETISVNDLGTGGTACTVAGANVTCNGAFNTYNVTYDWVGGVVNWTATPTNGNTVVCD